jgi:hypothetical protein
MTLVRFRIRRDTASNWTSVNPTLALGEPGLETDTRRVKYGDGSTAWNSLQYSTSPYDPADVAITGGSAVGLDEIGVGTSSPDGGVHVVWSGFDPFGNTNGALIVGGAYGGGLVWRDGASAVGAWLQDGGATFHLGFGTTSLSSAFQITSGALSPSADNSKTLGTASLRWSRLFAANARLTGLATYADDAAAGTAGLVSGDLYKTSDGAGGFFLKVKA